MMIAKTTAAGWSWTASPWILGTRKLFSTCWTTRYRSSAASTATGPTVAARRTAGTAAMIGPMIGTSSSTPAMTDSRTAYRPKIGSTSWLRTISPTKVAIPTAKPRMIWPRTHWPKSRSTVLMTAHVSNRHGSGSDRSKVATRVVLSLSR